MSAIAGENRIEGAPDTAPFIRVRNLTKKFGNFAALENVSIAASRGSTLALLGPSGCGKTTMLRCIAGLETPSEGSVEIGGRVMFDSARGIDVKPEQRELGIVFQSYAIWPHMTVAANIGFPLKVRGIPRRQIAERVDRMLSIMGLDAWRERPATDLSGGQQQRVALARALVHEPRIVLFDEPMSNLDARLRDQMRLELKVLQQRLNFTAIYVTHDQAEAFGLAQTVVVMNRGQIETIGSPQEVAYRPKTPFIARFLGYNVVEGTIVDQANGRWMQVALGDRLKVWGVAGAGVPATKGSPAVLCVRRERIGIAKAAAGSAPASDQASAQNEPPQRQQYPGQVRASSFQGFTRNT